MDDAVLVPHHDGSLLYIEVQFPSLGDEVRMRLRVPQAFGAVRSVHVRSNPNREPRFAEAAIVGTSDGWDWWEAAVEVENPVHGYRWLIVTDDGRQHWLNARGLHHVETLDSEDFRLVASDPVPGWVAESVLYQVFPDRFARSAGADDRPTPDWAIPAAWGDPVDTEVPGRSKQFYGGDLDGVREKLDHLAALGVNLLYLTPVFPARSNHRYDASSFDEVDPLLGGDEALVRLVEAAHARGIRVIGDLTSNHSGDGHEWFEAALGDPSSQEAEFYYWLDAVQDGLADGETAVSVDAVHASYADTVASSRRSYVSWLGVPSLPKFNWNSTELRRRFIEGESSVVAKWLRRPYGLDGWRIDVANMTGRYLDEDHNTAVRRIIRRTMAEVNDDTILLGASTNDAAGDFQGDAWHGAMTYANFTRPLWSWLQVPGSEAFGGLGFALGMVPAFTGRDFVEAHTRFAAGFPWRTRLGAMNALDTHDTPRFATHALPGVVPVALGLSVTLPGIPVVFAGDEFGLTGEDGEASRTPMPWDQADAPAIASRIELYAALIALRREHAALSAGGMRWLHVDDDVLVYVREAPDGAVLCVAARADHDITLPAHAVFGAEHAARAFGDGGLTASVTGLRLQGSGPSFSAWVLPGLAAAIA
ncbi:MAG: glycoside hydrolase family 13 protein [Leifsonia sp.]